MSIRESHLAAAVCGCSLSNSSSMTRLKVLYGAIGVLQRKHKRHPVITLQLGVPACALAYASLILCCGMANHMSSFQLVCNACSKALVSAM